MTIKELIGQLKEFPEDMEIIMSRELDYSPIYLIDTIKITGDYLVVDDDDEDGDLVVYVG